MHTKILFLNELTVLFAKKINNSFLPCFLYITAVCLLCINLAIWEKGCIFTYY